MPDEISTPRVTFQADGHIYQIDGRTVPSVTQVITLAGIDDVSHIPTHRLKRAAAVGTAVHQACEYLDEQDLDLDSLDLAIVGYVLGYQRFKAEHDFAPLCVERRGVAHGSGLLPYGFCLDRIGIAGDREVLIDIKTASKAQAWWGIQSAAYAEAVEFEGARLAVHVAKDGSYRIVEHCDPEDFSAWRAALAVAHWKLEHGAKLPQ